ncbi:MAG: DNA polymerase III, delta subunit [Chloroflexi bacterium]|jgi:DNA polymerase III delta subunit|nr:MAG: DNA polymerase III, delta subunit [Chloroflexota bacterium]
MIHIIIGSEEFLIKEKVRDIFQEIKINTDANLNIIEGKKIDSKVLISKLANMSLFDDKKISLVENYFTNFNGIKKATIITKLFQELANITIKSEIIFAEYPKENKNNFREDFLTAKSPIFKLIPKDLKIKYYELNRLKNFTNNNEIEDWLKKRCNKLSIKIDNLALKELINLKGNNLRSLLNEIKKLNIYVNNANITLKEVKELTIEWKNYNIFPIIDSIVIGKGNTSRNNLNKLLLKGDTSHQEILYRIANQTSQLLRISDIAHLPKNKISEKAHVSGFRLEKIITQAKKGRNYFANNLKIIKKYDIKIKSGEVNEKVALDLIINEFNR